MQALPSFERLRRGHVPRVRTDHQAELIVLVIILNSRPLIQPYWNDDNENGHVKIVAYRREGACDALVRHRDTVELVADAHAVIGGYGPGVSQVQTHMRPTEGTFDVFCWLDDCSEVRRYSIRLITVGDKDPMWAVDINRWGGLDVEMAVCSFYWRSDITADEPNTTDRTSAWQRLMGDDHV